MSRVIFKHIRNTANIGDRSCCPLDYLTFSNSAAIDLDEPTPPCDAVIFGGGKIFGSLSSKQTPEDHRAKFRIAWGVSTVQSNPLSIRYALSRRCMTIIGTRDFNDKRYEYAPCVSCLSPLLDTRYQIEHDVVFYMHHDKTYGHNRHIPQTIPTMDNHCSTMADAIAFLGSGQTVVSNSYHGVYWALLLGRRVLCLPFSNKFLGYRFTPGYSELKSWQNDINKARSYPEMLELSRLATISFERRVRELVSI